MLEEIMHGVLHGPIEFASVTLHPCLNRSIINLSRNTIVMKGCSIGHKLAIRRRMTKTLVSLKSVPRRTLAE